MPKERMIKELATNTWETTMQDWRRFGAKRQEVTGKILRGEAG